MHAAAITSEGLARAQFGPRARLSKQPAVADSLPPHTSAPPQAASPTAACPRAEPLGLSRRGAETMDVVEVWVYATLWLCCLFSLVYCFTSLF